MPIMARLLTAILLVAVSAVGELARAEDTGAGSLVIIGGALRYAQNDVWSRIVELAGGAGAKIGVFPTASSDPLKNGSRTVAALHAAGADAFLVPLRVVVNDPLRVNGTNPSGNVDVDYQQAAADPKLVEQIKGCGGVYFIGGSQERITLALGTSPGNRTPLLEAIWDVYRRGGVVAGSSAGAAVMSHMMFRQSRGVLKSLQEGIKVGQELAPGLGFLDSGWFVEQHCLTRGRFGRALVAMRTLELKYGVGVDENTAVVVRRGHEMSVIGYKGAIVMDLSQATTDPAIQGFNLKNARLSYLDHGDAFDLTRLQLTPSAEKRAEPTIDPQSASFHPARDDKLVIGDILGKTALADLLGKLIDNRQSEAIGLAFDADEARLRSTAGFEFREVDPKCWTDLGLG